MVTNAEINARRKARIGDSVASTVPKSKALSNLPRAKNYDGIVVPEKDLMPKAAYKELFWARIKDWFGVKGPRIVVEIGSRRGNFAAGLLERFSESHVFSIDPWAGRMGRNDLMFWTKRLENDVFERAFPLKGSSREWARAFPLIPDMVFIEATHDFKSVMFDLLTWIPRIRPEGVIVGQDYNQDGVKLAVDEYSQKRGMNFKSEAFGPHHGISFWGQV